MDEHAPTVVVSRRVREGHETAFREWNSRIRAAAEAFDGHLGNETQAPSPSHPDRWVTIYRFATPEQLDRWLVSPERQALIEEGHDHLVAPMIEQRLAVPSGQREVVTGVISQRIPPDRAAEFEAAMTRVSAEIAGFPGFVRSDVRAPVAGVQDDYVVVFSFETREDLDRWLSSPERRAVTAALDAIVDGDRTLNVVGGFAGWFSGASTAAGPTRWKQALTVLAGLYPVSLLIRWILGGQLAKLPWPAATLVSNILGIIALTWIVMPRLTRALRRWLSH
ncbi:MAG: antibiotic biosynthesis monooxygenase [Ilumatobacteraceae bacterium]